MLASNDDGFWQVADGSSMALVQDYARRWLFEPLGMMDTRLHVDAAGHAWTYGDMETTPRDLARLGVMMLNRGRWGERQIVSREWVARSVVPSQEFNPGYGLLWWLIEEPQGYMARGYLDTNLYVFPELELVVARMNRNPRICRREATILRRCAFSGSWSSEDWVTASTPPAIREGAQGLTPWARLCKAYATSLPRSTTESSAAPTAGRSCRR